MAFGARLRALRERRGLSQSRLAEVAKVAQPIIYRLEHDERCLDNHTVKVVQRLAHALGVTVDYLLGMNEPEETEVGA